MKANFNVQLYKNRKNVWLISLSLCLISIIGMLICLKSTSIKAPLNLGLDYTGGTQITLERSCIDECITLNTSDISNNIIALKKQNKNFSSNTSPNLTRSQIQLLDNSKLDKVKEFNITEDDNEDKFFKVVSNFISNKALSRGR